MIAPDRLRFGVLGFGKNARTRFLPAIVRVPSVCLTAIATRHPEQIDLASFPVTEPVQILRYEELLEHRQLLDAVYIALPNDLHQEWVLRCAEAGLHVLCEKPLTSQQAGALRCRQRCQQQGVLLAEGFMYRLDPRHQRVKELMQNGTVGQVHLLETSFSYVLEDLNNIRLQPERLGGALMDVGCYGIDCARLLFGQPVQVAASCVRGENASVDQLVAVTLVFPAGRMAVVTASTHLARHNAYCVRGTHGNITVPNAFNTPNEEPTRIVIDFATGEQQTEDFPPFRAFESEIAHFAQAVRFPDPVRLLPMEDGVANSEVLEAALHFLQIDGREK